MIGIALWLLDSEATSNKFTRFFDYVEFSLDYPIPVDTKKMKKMLKGWEGKISFHSPWGGIQIFHPVTGEISMKLMERCMKIAEKYEALYFVVHQTLDIPTYKILKSKIRELIARRLKRFEAWSEENGIVVAFENTGRIFFGTPEQFSFLKNSDNLFLCLDIGHIFETNNKLKKTPVSGLKPATFNQWIKQYKKKIIVTHLQGVNVRDGTCHLPINSHTFNDDWLKKLENCKYYTLEIHSSFDKIIKSFRYVKKFLK